jgi:glycosyltransferase involved in cell wall biosynthesis
MVLLRDVLEHALNLCNAVTVVYFFLGNGIYTLLMAISLASAVAYNRRIAYQPARDRRSPGAEPPLTVLIPAFNEEASIVETVHSALRANYPDLSVVVVDDGSSDQSQAVIRKIAATDSRVKGVFLGRNAGQTSALSAGIQKSSGTLIASLDADGQNDPKDLERLISKLNEGYDVVSGWRKHRKDPWLNRRLPSQIANALISRVTGVYLHDYGCSLKIYKSEYLKPIRLYGEMHRFVPAFAGFLGAKITELEVNHRPRIKGKSKYGISRSLKVIVD